VAERPVLDLLVTDGAPVGQARTVAPDADEVALSALYAHPEPRTGNRTWVRANMVTTLDGAATGGDGVSGTINGAADHRVFRVLRAATDVVLVGAGTVRAEGYTPLSVPDGLRATRAAAGRAPVVELAIVTRSGDLPEQITDLHQHPAGTVPPIVLTTTAGADRLAGYPTERVVVTGETTVDLAVALDALADRGLVHVLAEGGPSLLGDLVDADLLDELCLTTSPLMVGGPAPRIVHTSDYLHREGRPAARLVQLLHSDGVLLARWDLGRGGR
jgi:riboflavin biosynthesis pyrimidine reductase